ncbi:MAG: hypothetical protein HY810_01780 [Candidatus Omnitrophica bacterium]|nr:hypothetical protein [Candidatus Omnitrophota bacterium]
MLFFRNKLSRLIVVFLLQAILLVNFAYAQDIEISRKETLDCLGPRLATKDAAFLVSFSDELGKASEEIDEIAKKFLTNEQFAKYLVVKAIWIEGHFNSLKSAAEKVSAILEKAPMVRKVYGIGYPFYGRVDLRKRIYSTLKRLESGEINNLEFLRRITPDLDVLIVVNQEDEGPWDIKENMDAILKEYFIRYVSSFRRPWADINRSLQKDTILTDIYADRNKALDILMEKGEYSLDFIYVPEHVWDNIPVFIMKGDMKYFKFIRDILFSLQNNFEKPSDVPTEFLHNYVLNALFSAGEIKREYLIDKLLDEHPYAELIAMYEISREIVKNKFEGAVKLAQQRGLIEYYGDRIVLTNKGRVYVEKVLEYRQLLLEKGYDLSGNSFIKQRSAIEKKAEKVLLLTGIKDVKNDISAGELDSEALLSLLVGQAI